MIRVENAKKVEASLKAIIQGITDLKNKSGTNIVEEVVNTPREPGTPLSPESAYGQPREALFEAVYQAEIRPSQNNIQNAEMARSEMNEEELSKEEDALVDRFIRDFINDILGKI